MSKVFFFLALMAGIALSMPPVWAAEEVEVVEEVEEIGGRTGDTTRADDWFTSQTPPMAKDLELTGDRYIRFYWDDSLTYWIDAESIRWIFLPYSTSEYILDVWIKMETVPGTADYSYPKKYYMEHYYLRPEKKQVQFLSELEVTGRPQNAIRERQYDPKNWENLVPGSVEEKVYWAVTTILKDLEKAGIVKKRKRTYDFWDDTLRIGGVF